MYTLRTIQTQTSEVVLTLTEKMILACSNPEGISQTARLVLARNSNAMACLSSPAASKWAAPRVAARPREVLGLGRGQPYHPRRHDVPTPYHNDHQVQVHVQSNLDTMPGHEEKDLSLHPDPYSQFRHQEAGYHHMHELREQSHYSGRQFEDQVPPYADAQRYYVVKTQTPSNKGNLPAPTNSISETFAPLKSPMSQCIATIIGAGKFPMWTCYFRYRSPHPIKSFHSPTILFHFPLSRSC